MPVRPYLEEMADMPVPLFAYDAPPTLADHPHAREHQHTTFMQYLARKQPDPKNYPNYPDVDIRDAINHYLIELECPGIKDAADIHCQWTSSRHLTVTGDIARPEESQIEAQIESRPVYLVLGERRIGSFRRNFTFPVEVEQENMTAKLEAGLLKIVLPKHKHHIPKGTGKVDIDVIEGTSSRVV